MSSSTDLNRHDDLVLWFDDLGSGNEQYNFLSNFYEGAPITLPGVTKMAVLRADPDWPLELHTGLPDSLVEFRTGEHAFAAMKFFGSDYRHFFDIVKADDPNTAKALGRSREHPIREDWEIVKLDVMAAVTRAKYEYDVRPEADMLLATGDKLLVEGTWWGDEVWGVALDIEGLPGRNWLGTLLMARRAELRAMEFTAKTSDFTAHFVTETGKHNSHFAL